MAVLNHFPVIHCSSGLSSEIVVCIGQDAYDMLPFENQGHNERDFIFTYPNMAGCLEAEFRHIPLLTVRNIRGGVSGLNHYGGSNPPLSICGVRF